MADFSSSFWMERAIGATAGAAVSLVYMMPQGPREAACRFVAGLVAGMVFGAPAGLWLATWLGLKGQILPEDMMLSGAAVVSLSAWWALGVLARVASRAGRRG